MARKRTQTVMKSVTEDELSRMISREKSRARIVSMLIFIRLLYRGMSVPRAASELAVSKRSCYLWLKRWNSKGVDGLVPMHGGGFRSKLTAEQVNDLRNHLSNGSWSTGEVMNVIRSRYNIDYSMRQVSRILGKFRMHHAKPYPHD